MIKRVFLVIFLLLLFPSVLLAATNGVPYEENFDSFSPTQKSTCWDDIATNWRDEAYGDDCGYWNWVGSEWRMELDTAQSHSGSYSLRQKQQYNEDRGQAYYETHNPVSYSSGYDELYYQVWIYFDAESGAYNHAAGQKMMRMVSSNDAALCVDIIVTFEDNEQNDDLDGIAIKQNDVDYTTWASYAGSFDPVNDDTWYLFELAVKVNTPGQEDGWAKLWQNGNLIINAQNKTIRGSNTCKLNQVLVGGWYSDGSGEGGPGKVQYIYKDDFKISTSYIGMGVDETPPELSSATIAANGTTLSLLFNESVKRGVSYENADWDIDCSIGGDNIGISYTSGDPGTTLTYTISKTIYEYETCDIDFNGDANSIEDIAGNDLTQITSVSITNNSTQPQPETAAIQSLKLE